MLGLVLLTASPVRAQAATGAGLVLAVDSGAGTLTLETRSGVRELRVEAAATIRGDRGESLALASIRPGDAVSYRTASTGAISLHVVRSFWGVPEEP
jgi:hypothetical protein